MDIDSTGWLSAALHKCGGVFVWEGEAPAEPCSVEDGSAGASPSRLRGLQEPARPLDGGQRPVIGCVIVKRGAQALMATARP
jgi:hypothetical protein